jgi:hypothetical protein
MHSGPTREKRQVFKTLGSDATQALADLNREQRRLTARLTAADAEDMTLLDRRETRIDLYERKDAWLNRLRTRGKTRAAETMAISIGDFLEMTGHRYAASSPFPTSASLNVAFVVVSLHCFQV